MYNLHEIFSKGVCIMKDNSIKAVYDGDLEHLLQSLGVYDGVMQGKYKCVFCGNTINMDNIDGILPINNDVAFSCNAPSCQLNLIAKESLDESK